MARRKPAAVTTADDSKFKRKNIKASPPSRQRVTRAMTARSVPMAVFNTAELLERILLQVEPRTSSGFSVCARSSATSLRLPPSCKRSAGCEFQPSQ
ncbi:hypothetical protein LTR95_015411 [Oleoguttula sp. CCFEE 5521]